MKFSEFDGAKWGELQPYLDTCVLPVTGLDGGESPAEATERLERLRDLLELIEHPFTGRIVTYPAFHYASGSAAAAMVEQTVANMRQAGFRYAVVVTLSGDLQQPGSLADLWIMPERDGTIPTAASVSASVQAMWKPQRESRS
jgi:23S rRNA (pseudouridine1915-N3)-methyltransferase